MTEPILEVSDLRVAFTTDSGPVPALDGVDFSVAPGESVGVVGESGSGKSVTMAALLGLLPNNARVTGGEVRFQGQDLLRMSERRRTAIRGKSIGLVMQDPMTSLDPLMKIGEQIGEGIRAHERGVAHRQAYERSVDLLQQVGIPQPKMRASQFPHELSGGMRQRVLLAMAIANNPALIIADEPTTALDVTIQAQILELLQRLCQESGSALILVTHDLSVVAQMTDRVVVMYSGRAVETGSVERMFEDPRHPYTRGLLMSLPRFDGGSERLHTIPGYPLEPWERPTGCAFQSRCELFQGREACRTRPPMFEVGADHRSACHFHDELGPLPARSSAS